MSENKWRALDNINVTMMMMRMSRRKLIKSHQSTQQSFESIVVKDSEDVEVHTTDTQVALSLQAAHSSSNRDCY